MLVVSHSQSSKLSKINLGSDVNQSIDNSRLYSLASVAYVLVYLYYLVSFLKGCPKGEEDYGFTI